MKYGILRHRDLTKSVVTGYWELGSGLVQSSDRIFDSRKRRTQQPMSAQRKILAITGPNLGSRLENPELLIRDRS